MKKFALLTITIVLLSILLMYQATKTSAAAVYIPSTLLVTGKSINRIRVAGRVADKKIVYQTSPSFLLSFNLRDQNDTSSEGIPVTYKGLKPDMFEIGRDVIIDGDYIDGVVIATNLLTQCPSKYEPPKPTK